LSLGREEIDQEEEHEHDNVRQEVHRGVHRNGFAETQELKIGKKISLVSGR
jgi:glutathionyl-hydroquinone reductase